MICSKCGFMMDAFDEECPRCLKQRVARQIPQPNPPAPRNTPLSPVSATDAVWHYEISGRRFGPVDLTTITNLIAGGKITRDTPVWRKGMQNYTSAHLTELNELLPTYQALPKPSPALNGLDVNNSIVWTLAFVPIISVFIQDMLGTMTQSSPIDFWWVAVILNIALCVADQKQLKNSGHEVEGSWSIFLVPVYLFMRASKFKQSNSYAFVWLFAFFVSLFAFSPKEPIQIADLPESQSSSDSAVSAPSSGVASAPESSSNNCFGDLCIENMTDQAGEFSGAIVGTIVNNSDHTYGYAQIEINLYDSSGAQVGSAMDNINNLEPHGRWKFSAVVFNQNTATYKVKGISAY